MNENRSKNLIFLVYLLLAVGTAVCFWQVRNFDFVNYDDNIYVYENQHVLKGLTSDGIIWAFTTSHSANWHPLTWLSLMFDCQLFGHDAGKIHLVNLLLHIANTLLLFALLKEMTGSLWPSAFVAAVFALHPVHIQSVAWISERKDVLSTLFFMLTLLAYANYVRRGGLIRYLLAILFFIFGLLAKPMLVTLPFVMLLLDYWPLNRFALKDSKPAGRQSRKSTGVFVDRKILYSILIEKIPFLALAVLSSIITLLVQRSGGAVIAASVLLLKDRVANVFLSYIRYIGKMFWPQNLAIFYPFDLGRFPFWQILLCVMLLLIISLCVIRLRRKHKYLFVGWCWFIITLLPVIGLVQVGKQSWADRYTYIPYIGLFIMVAWGLPELFLKLPHGRKVVGISALTVLTALGMCTYRQVSYWNNSGTILTHAIEVTEGNYLAHYNLAGDLYEHGKTALALEHYKKAIEILPDYTNAAIAIGCIVAQQGDIAQSIEYFRKALQFEPDSAKAHYNLGISLQKQGRLDEAVVHYRRVIQLTPDFAEAHYSLAKILFLQGSLDEAVERLREAFRLRPDWLEPMNNFAWLIAVHPEIKNRNISEAITVAQRACELTDYKNPTLLASLAAAYASAGRFSDAINTATTALNLADTASQPQIKDAIQYHLSFYRQGKPYIEPAPKP